eukprot:4681048-Pyramimonas_sp.AAC.1
MRALRERSHERARCLRGSRRGLECAPTRSCPSHACRGAAWACPDSSRDGEDGNLDIVHVHVVADDVRLLIIGYCRVRWVATGCLV